MVIVIFFLYVIIVTYVESRKWAREADCDKSHFLSPALQWSQNSDFLFWGGKEFVFLIYALVCLYVYV